MVWHEKRPVIFWYVFNSEDSLVNERKTIWRQKEQRLLHCFYIAGLEKKITAFLYEHEITGKYYLSYKSNYK